MTAKTPLEVFTEYFIENYPGPNTVITDPRWHAPKIFRAAQAAIEGPKTNGAEAVEADPLAYLCPSCRAVKPRMAVTYTQAEVPGMGELIYATIFCGECRVILTTQILEMQSAALAAQKAGFPPPNKSGLWTPGGRGN